MAGHLPTRAGARFAALSLTLLLSGLVLVLAACGDKQETVAPTGDATGSGNKGGDSTQAQGGGEPGADGTLWGVTNVLYLVGVDLATGEELPSPSQDQIVEPLTPLNSIAISDGRVWLVTGTESSVTGGDGGRVLVLDATTGEEVDTLEYGGGVSALAGDDGKVYIAHSEADGTDVVVERFDAATLASEARARVVEDNPSHTVEALVPDGDTLWVLQGNGFALHKVDAATLEVQETVRLGRHDDGSFGDLYGYGKMVQVGDVLWVVDNYNKDLLRVDKTSLQPEVVGSIEDYLLGRIRLSANSDSVFLATGDSSAGRVVRFDGDTGEHVDTYELGEDGARAFAVDDDHLYVNEDYFGDLVEIDLQTGETQRTLPVPGPEIVAVDGI
jgi:outer membrane protein assembly factor BamB